MYSCIIVELLQLCTISDRKDRNLNDSWVKTNTCMNASMTIVPTIYYCTNNFHWWTKSSYTKSENLQNQAAKTSEKQFRLKLISLRVFRNSARRTTWSENLWFYNSPDVWTWHWEHKMCPQVRLTVKRCSSNIRVHISHSPMNTNRLIFTAPNTEQ